MAIRSVWVIPHEREGNHQWHPLRAVLLLGMLGMGWSEFELPLGPAPADISRSSGTSWVPVKFVERYLAKHKATVKRLLRSDSRLRRTDLQRIAPQALRYIYQADRKWLDIQVPALPRNSFHELRLRASDIEAARKIREAAKSEFSDRDAKPIRVTAFTLGKAAGMTKQGRPVDLGSFPLARLEVLKAAETMSEFRLRQFSWAPPMRRGRLAGGSSGVLRLEWVSCPSMRKLPSERSLRPYR